MEIISRLNINKSLGYIDLPVGTATTSALLQILGILRWCRQEDRKPRSQDFKPAPAWIISSEQMESGPGALPGVKCWRAAANS